MTILLCSTCLLRSATWSLRFLMISLFLALASSVALEYISSLYFSSKIFTYALLLISQRAAVTSLRSLSSNSMAVAAVIFFKGVA